MAELATIRANLLTQDNRITADPIFMVQGLRRIYGIDKGYTDNVVWLDDESIEASGDDLIECLAAYDRGEERKGWTRTGYVDIWEHVQPFFTEVGANHYLKINGHNLRHYKEVRIYVESAFRNEEWQAVREMLMERPVADLGAPS